MKLPFFQVDAFAERPFAGNYAAVMPLEAWLPDETLQAIAEGTTSAKPPSPCRPRAMPITSCAGSRRRREVALCGHATLASGTC
jgi:predicted PhzF superfamily epimerase YddE/YHI9